LLYGEALVDCEAALLGSTHLPIVSTFERVLLSKGGFPAKLPSVTVIVATTSPARFGALLLWFLPLSNYVLIRLLLIEATSTILISAQLAQLHWLISQRLLPSSDSLYLFDKVEILNMQVA
jgi:hypothetical protein